MTYAYIIKRVLSGTWAGYYIALYAKKGTPIWMSHDFFRALLRPLSPLMLGFYWRNVYGLSGSSTEYYNHKVDAERCCMVHAARGIAGEQELLYNPYEELSELSSDEIKGLAKR